VRVEEVDPRAVREHEVAEDDVRLLPLDGRVGLLERGRRLDAPPLFLEHDREEVAEGCLVVDDEQVHGGILVAALRSRRALES